MRSRYELIVFDVAGTTVLDGDIVVDAMGAALAERGLPIGRDAIRAVMGIPKPVAIAMLAGEAAGVGEEGSAFVERVHDTFLRLLRDRYEADLSVREAEGARDVFAALRAHGIKVALDTGFGRSTLDLLLRRLSWSAPDVIDCSVTSDEAPSGRPGPGLIRRAMELTGVTSARTVVKVGDTPADVESGRAAGCGLVVAVSYGTHSREELRALGPSAVIDRLPDLLPLVIPG